MKKTTVLQIEKIEAKQPAYAIIPELTGLRKDRSIDFFKDDHLCALLIDNDMPTVAVFNKDTNEWEKAIEFFKRVNNQFFGKSYATGKCIYGLSSHPWHKKVKQAEFTLFESEVNFDDLYYYDYHDGKYVPEFSIKQNWIQAYHLQHHDNLKRSLDYALSQPDTPEMKLIFDAMREKGLLAE